MIKSQSLLVGTVHVVRDVPYLRNPGVTRGPATVAVRVPYGSPQRIDGLGVKRDDWRAGVPPD